jgi:hypothetical protein
MTSAQIEKPVTGDIVRYRYIWAKEAKEGHESKGPHPCLILDARDLGAQKYEVLVVPLTHEPQHDSKFLKIADAWRQGAGLDDYEQYLVYNEANVFVWPTFDVVAVRSRDFSQVIRGKLPHDIVSRVREEFRELREAGKAVVVDVEKLKRETINAYRRNRGYPER